MSDEFKNEDFENENDKTTLKKVTKWIQENLRVIVSVLIVALIASSIYSYSKRGEKNNDTEVEKILSDISSRDKDNKKSDQNDKNQSASKNETAKNENKENKAVSNKAATTKNKQTDKENQAEAKSENGTEEVKNDTTKQTQTNNKTEQDKTQQKEDKVIEPETKNNEAQVQPKEKTETKETENSFIESAAPGDGLTNLARKALAHYLEKNPDSSLTPEHKIYIEDYLRKNVNYHGRIYTGTTVEFSKSLIKNAIDASKNLNDAQLKNLHKYAVNVRF